MTGTQGRWKNNVRVLCALAAVSVLLLPRLSLALDPPDPPNVLFVANGWYPQEDDIETHMLDLGYDVVVKKDYRVYASTDLSVYDLIVITEFAPGLSYSALSNINSSGVPVLIVEYWDFWYSYRLGLTSTENCGYVGTDTITSMQDGYTDFTSRVGSEALVYQPYYTVYGIDLADVQSGVTPLYWSSESFGEVAVLVDYERKIAATGVYDTRKYTNDAWKMFDTLVEQIVPMNVVRETIEEVATAYAESGLIDLVEQVRQDVARDPNSWTYDQAEEEAWLLTTEWRLAELWGHTTKEIAEIFETWPFEPFVIYDHPSSPHNSDEYWFLGRAYGEFPPLYWPFTVPHYSEYHDGTDLGLSVQLGGRTIYYMGDTDPSGDSISFSNCPAPAYCNDMIVFSNDGSASNGVNVSIATPTGEPDKFLPQSVPGVHRDVSSLLAGYWSGTVPAYTVPSGAVVAHPTYYFLSLPPIPFQLETVIIWYSTAIHPGLGDTTLDSSDPRKRPTSWTGCSFDGIHFYKCYSNMTPFSIDSTSPNLPSRFIQIAAIELTASDFEAICPGGAMCDLYDEEAHPAEKGGILLYGAGRPYRKSGLFLAYVSNPEIGEVDAEGRPLAWYWMGTGWSRDEEAAVDISGGGLPCDNELTPNNCNVTVAQAEDLFGELSASIVHSSEEESVIVILSNHLQATPKNVLARTARLSAPWDVSDPTPTNTDGYGPYIIDRYTEHDGLTGDIGLYHTISVWKGGAFSPYGVYTGYEEIAWPSP